VRLVVPGDLDKLQGTWNVVSLEADGQNMPGAGEGSMIVIKGNKFTSIAQARPAGFSSKAGDGRSYTTWRLARK
jgi:uncharacterized protein (TIGR03067 family)